MISFQIHQNTFHKNIIKKQQCPQCNKLFGNKNSLKAHLKWHYSIKLLERAQEARRKKEAGLAAQAKEARKRQLRMPHKSVPAKLLRPQ